MSVLQTNLDTLSEEVPLVHTSLQYDLSRIESVSQDTSHEQPCILQKSVNKPFLAVHIPFLVLELILSLRRQFLT